MSEVFNYDRIMKVTADDDELAEDLIALFRQQSPQWLQDLSETVADSDAGRISRAAHTIKGALANLGGISAARTAARLETMGREDNISLAAETFDQLKRDVAGFEQATANLAGSTTS